MKILTINTTNYKINILFTEDMNKYKDLKFNIIFHISEYDKFKKLFDTEYIYNKYTIIMIKSYKDKRITFEQLKSLIF